MVGVNSQTSLVRRRSEWGATKALSNSHDEVAQCSSRHAVDTTRSASQKPDAIRLWVSSLMTVGDPRSAEDCFDPACSSATSVIVAGGGGLSSHCSPRVNGRDKTAKVGASLRPPRATDT